MKKTTSGFTLVELLIVIVVIAILATISVVAYSGVQSRAIETAVKSDLSNFAKKIEIIKLDTPNGNYPQFSELNANTKITVSKSAYKLDRFNWYYCASPDGASYSVGVIDKENRTYFLTSANGLQNGSVGSMDSTQNCNRVGSPPNYDAGYAWNASSSTGTWRNWIEQ